MAASPEQRARLLDFFEGMTSWLAPALEPLATDPVTVFAAARDVFAELIDELPYLDQPDHVMAEPMFACASTLAVYQVLRTRGVGAHTWGQATLELPAVAGDPEDGARWRSDAEASQQNAAPNEFVFALATPSDGPGYGMDVSSCAICHLFGKHDAAELVPYMCAFDDVMSQASGTGLRRTGTIALGAGHCDFRFQPGGDPLALAEQYPDQIRVRGR